MESKSILQKPELIVVSVLALLAMSSSASAAMSMISTEALGKLLTDEALNILGIVMFLGMIYGLILIMSGPQSRAKGFGIVGMVAVAAMLFFVIPGIVDKMEDIAVTAGNSSLNGSTLMP